MWSKFFKKKKNGRADDMSQSEREIKVKENYDYDYGGGSTPRGDYKRSNSNPPAFKQVIDASPHMATTSSSAASSSDLDNSVQNLTINEAHPSIIDISPPKRPRQFSGPEISPEDITLINVLSASEKGNQGIVYKALCKGMDVCVKEVKLPTDRSGEKAIANFTNEVKLFSEISHSNVCMFYGACLRPGNWRLVTELCVGDLSDLIKNKKKQITLYEKLLIGRDVCRGMAWLHHCGVLHLDLKPENLLLDERGTVKVTDFGYSKIKADSKLMVVPDENLSEGGSPLYMAPERLDRKQYGPSADVYSFGIMFWQLLTRKEPFLKYQLIGDRDIFNKAVIIDKERPEIPEVYTRELPGLEQLLASCWADNPRDRPTFVQLVSAIDNLLVDSAVHDPVGREFWKTYFFKKPVDLKTKVAADSPVLQSKVPYKEFMAIFSQLIGLDKVYLNSQLPEVISDAPLSSNPTDKEIQEADEQQLRIFAEQGPEAKAIATREFKKRQTLLKVCCLEKFLSDEDEMVTLERFGKIIDIFGPLALVHPGVTSNLLKLPILGEDLLGKMFEMMNQPWFHGDMSMNEAFALLKDKDVGVFLVRFSSTTNQFVISNVVRKDGGRYVVHIRVKHQPGVGFTIPDSTQPEPDLFSLLRAHQDKFAKPQAPEATKYRYITTMTISKDGGYGENDEVGILW